MQRLSRQDLGHALACLRDIYAETDLDGFAQRLVAKLPELVRSDATSFNTLDTHTGAVTWLGSVPIVSDIIPDGLMIFDQHRHEHALIDHYRRHHDPHARTLSDVLPRSVWQRRALYHEFFRRLGLEHQLAVIFPTAPPLAMGLGLARSGQDFSGRDRAMLDLLRPHLAQAYQNAAALTAARRALDHLQEAVAGVGLGLIVLGDDGRARSWTEQARQWQWAYFGAPMRSGHLPEALRRWVVHQKALLHQHPDAPPPLEPFIIERPDSQLIIRFMVSRTPGDYLLVLEEHRQPLSVDQLNHLGLTRRESEILNLIAHGQSNKEVAAALSISPLTVRKHTENIFHKLDVSNRAEAVARVLTAPPADAWLPDDIGTSGA